MSWTVLSQYHRLNLLLGLFKHGSRLSTELFGQNFGMPKF